MGRPKPAEGAPEKHCPFIGSQCIGSHCMFWVEIWGRKDGGDPVLDKDCAINWTVTLQAESLKETARVTVGHDKVATEVQRLTDVLGVGLRMRAAELDAP